MPDTGAPFNLPYPAPTDPADVPADMQALAEGITGHIVLAGSSTVEHTNSNTATLDVTFPTPFPAAPVVLATQYAKDTYLVGTAAATTTGFRIRSKYFDGTARTESYQVYWMAVLGA